MRLLDLSEAGYEGQSEAQQHYFRIEGDIDQERGINDTDCEEITKQLVNMGLQAHCEPDESRNDVVQIHTYSGRTTVADALTNAGYEADSVGSPTSMAIEQALSETHSFTKADFDENESKNYHTENGVELAKAFGTPEEIEAMEEIAKNHYARGHILSDEIEARNKIVSKYFPALESQEEAMAKMNEGDLGPGDLELLKPMINMKPAVLKMYAKNIIKKYPHLADNIKRMLPTNEATTNTNRITDLQDLNIHDEDDLKAADSMSAEELKKELIIDLHHLHSEAVDNFTDDDHIADEMGDYWNNMHRKADDKTLEIYSLARDLMGEDPAVVAQMTEKYLRMLGDTYINNENNANVFKTGANNAMSLTKNMTNMHSKIDAKLANSSVSKTPAYKNYKASNQANKISAMRQGMPYGRQDIGEDVEDETKIVRLQMMQQQLEDLKSNFEILTKLDQRGTGAGDLTDQITTMYKAIESLEGVLGRSLKIVPEQVEVNEFDIKKSFNNIANNVKKGISAITNTPAPKPVKRKPNTSNSIASQINWGGQYNEEDLNELDLFAPKTDYVKTPGGEYYKIEYRNTGTVTGGGHGNNDKASFVSINPASDKEVSALNLDDKIANDDIYVHQGHEHQGGTPFSQRDIKVYDYGTQNYDEEIPNSAKMKLIKVMTTETEKKKKSKLGTKIRSWQETKADMKKKIEASKPGDKK